MKSTVITMLTLLAMVGCKGPEEIGGDPSFTSFSQHYALSDFKLNSNYDYWEIRRGALSGMDVEAYHLLYRFDETAYAHLSGTQAEVLGKASSQTGFSKQCQPVYCPIYGVALQDGRAVVLDSVVALLEFFGEINTEAELFILLEYAQTYAESTHPETFQATDDGYLVELSWDTLCQLRGKDLVKVGKDGKIEKIREINRESYQACV